MQNPFRTVLLFTALALAGLALLPQLQVDLYPAGNRPELNISFSLPATPPELVEQLVTAPLENALSGLGGLKNISSISENGRGSIGLLFEKSEDMDQKRFEVATIIRRMYKQLPEGLSYPVVQQGGNDDRSAMPLLVYSIFAPLPPEEIKSTAERLLARPLAQLPNVQQATVTGAQPWQLKLTFDRHKMAVWGLQKADLANALHTWGRGHHLGVHVLGSGQPVFVEATASLQQVADLEALPLAMPNGTVVPLGTVARVERIPARPSSFYRVNGQNAVPLVISAHKGSNRLAVGKAVKTRLNKLAAQLPPGHNLRNDYDDTEFVAAELDKIYVRSSLSVLILVLFILLVRRNLRYLAVLLSGIAVNLSLVGICLWALGLGIHLYTLAGLTVSFGILLDNALVMLDHYHRQRDRRVFLALLAASLTSMAALLLVLLLPEEERMDLGDFAMVVSLGIATSLVVALWYTPAAWALWIGKKTPAPGAAEATSKGFRYYTQLVQWLARKRKWTVAATVLLFGTPVFWLPMQWEGQEWYNRTLGNEWYLEEVRPWTDKLLGGSLRLFVRDVFEKSGYRSNERTRLYVNARMPVGHTLEQMDAAMRQIEQ